jgi:serine-aspartate repeat-containing protein C/D/E
VPSVIWKAKRNRDRNRRGSVDGVKRRSRGPERLESRRLLAADAIHVGVVYLETDYLETDQDVGSDSRGDRFILSFTGGAPNTQLSELRIRTDKDGDGISVGDPIYDTAQGGRGKNGAHGFQVVRVQSPDGHQVDASAEVEDGGQELILRLSNFHAGDRLEFTLDVDEVLRNALDLAVFNDRLDVITSGQEFQDSILEASFNAPHYETSHADAIFLNDYGDPPQTHGLDLPPDSGSHVDSRPNRSAAAVASVVQVPKPIEISGRVWIDSDLDAQRAPDEQMLAGVEISLWKLIEDGSYVDTDHRATTNVDGLYVFSKSLGLMPGQYRVVQSQPEGFFSVSAVPGSVSGLDSGNAETSDTLTSILLPLGDTSAINYDFAEAQPASLSGFVFLDDNNDGVRNSGEQGIAGVRVQLVPVDTIARQSALTETSSSDGSYSFSGLAPGSYEVIEVDQPTYLNDGIDAAGRVDGQIVGVAHNPGDRVSQIFLAGSAAGTEYNFGEVPFGAISGSVYLAIPGHDCSGDHNAADAQPQGGVDVELQTDAGVMIARTTTGSDGRYRFEDVPVGNYRIIEFTPGGLIDGSSHVGRVDGLLSGTSIDGGLIQSITMTPAGVGVEYNFCEAAPASISGYVYQDQSNDGSRDANESGIAGTRVSLIDASGQVVSTQDTDGNGRYQFLDLAPGE